MLKRVLAVLLLFVAGGLGSWSAAGASSPQDLESLPSPWSGPAPALPGHFRASAESLGFDAYRHLEPDDQLERRETAKRLVRRGNEANLKGVDLDPYATAVGYCPYLPEAWQRYAQGLNELGQYSGALYCLALTQRTLKYESSKRKREEIAADYFSLLAAVAYNVGDAALSYDSAVRALEMREDDDLKLLKARALIDLQRFDEAVQTLDQFDHHSPAYARSLSTRALLEMQRGQLDAAEDAFARAYKYGMRGPIFENDRGRLALTRDQLDDAIEHFQSAIASLPSFMEARNNLAVAYRRAGRLSEAEATLQEALRLSPDYAAAHFNLAEIYREQLSGAAEDERERLGRLAYEHYTQALLHGYDPDLVIERRGGLALSVQDLGAAEEDLLRVTEDPDIDGRVLYLLGRVKKQQGELRIAATLYEMALARGHQEAEVYSDLGEVRLRQGDYSAARELLGKALERNPKLVVTRVNLCVALVELGDLPAADTVLREAEAIAPDNELVRAQRDVLRQLGVGE
jgi:tetratricopeptide (TPR) repeat protein